MPMNERHKEMLLKLYKRLDLVVMGLLLVFLIWGGYLILKETSYTQSAVEAPAPRQPVYKVPNAVQANIVNADYDKILKSFVKANPDINADDQARRIIQNNMFVMKSAEETQAIREEMNVLYNQAERAEQAGNVEEARKLVNDILRRDPGNALAKQLQQKLDARTAQTPAATPAGP